MRIFNFLKNNSEHRKSIRVNTNIGDKYINVKLGQTYESMDILSLKIFQKDLYRLFDADYGIIVGRVLGQGVGIPNAKVSVFIPLDEEDITSPTTLEDIKKIEATALYPFQTVFDKDGNGKVYNLLPKYSRNRNVNGFPDNPYGIGATPKTPVGTFPEKDEILVNETVAYVYDKYLKFTTVTNESGDYILTVPANKSYNVNMSCDITDIGRFSTCAALLKLEGYSDVFFSEDGRTLNEDIELERLPNIDIQNNSITVKPLWSQNTSNANVGINRLDFNLVKKIKPFTTIVGNFFTQNNGTWWGDRIIFRLFFGLRNLCVGNCPDNVQTNDAIGIDIGVRICGWGFDTDQDLRLTTGFSNAPDMGCDTIRVCIVIRNVLPFFTIGGILVNKYCQLNGGRNDYSPFDIINLGKTSVCSIKDARSALNGITDDLFIQSHQKGNIDLRVFNVKNSVTEEDAQILNEEAQSIANDDSIFDNYSYQNDIQLYPKDKYVFYQNNGSFITLINCNRNKVITNENGDLIPVDDKSEKGVFTSFRGYFYVTNDAPIDNPPTRNRTGKIALKIPQFIDYGDYKDSTSNFNKWVWKHFKFDYGKIYSVAQYNNVRVDWMKSEDEKSESTIFSNNIIGFHEQTNILFFGGYEDETESTNTYLRNRNDDDENYKDFYNHITLLGIDVDNTDTFGDDDVFVPPTSPEDNTEFNVTIRIGGTFAYTDTTIQNPTQRLYFVISSSDYLNYDFIVDYININIFNIDVTFSQTANYSLKIARDDNDIDITKYTNTLDSEWLPIPLIQYNDTNFETESGNPFTIDSDNMIKEVYDGPNLVPNTPYISVNDNGEVLFDTTLFVPCILYIRKNDAVLTNPNSTKAIPIAIRVIES